MMKFTMPILAVIVAILLVLSQAIYTVDQTRYAIKFQLGEIIEVQNDAGLYFKVPLLQNVRFFDRRNLTLENSEVDRVVTSEQTPIIRKGLPSASVITSPCVCMRKTVPSGLRQRLTSWNG